MLVILIFLIGLSGDIDRLSGEGFQVRLVAASAALVAPVCLWVWLPRDGAFPPLSFFFERVESRAPRLAHHRPVPAQNALAPRCQLLARSHLAAWLSPPSRAPGGPSGSRLRRLPRRFRPPPRPIRTARALRTKGDEFSITWREYADKVEATAAGLAGLGLERGGTMAIMLTNRPSSTGSTRRRCTSAPRRSRSTTPTTEQIQYQVEDAGASILVTERPSRTARRPDRASHVLVVDESALARRGSAADGFDFEAAWRAVQPGRPPRR